MTRLARADGVDSKCAQRVEANNRRPELGHADPFSLAAEDWAWWIRTRPGPEGSLGWPLPSHSPAAS